jgi:hypothetical protein
MTYLRVVKTIFYERAQRVSTANIVFNRRSRAYFSVQYCTLCAVLNKKCAVLNAKVCSIEI